MRCNQFDRLLSIGTLLIPAKMKMHYQEHTHRKRKELKEWEQEMWLKWKIPIWGLDKVAFAHAPNLLSHLLLIIKIAHMFDNRIREDNIKLVALELLHIASIALYTNKVGQANRTRLHV